MEAATRFELVNKGFADLCLTTWLRRHGDPTATRTRDTLIKSQVLYRLSYWTMLAGDTGFEPVNDGIKVRCLTAWRIPNN